MTGLAGTGSLVRLALRRDRITLPSWILVFVVSAAGSAAATVGLYPTVASRVQAALVIDNRDGDEAADRESLAASTVDHPALDDEVVILDAVHHLETRDDKIAAANELSGALGRLLAVAERYPDLKANQQFGRLSDELAGTENRIAVERMRYNDAVRAYNSFIKSFPTMLYAEAFGFHPQKYFEAPEEAKKVPRVDFGTPSEKAPERPK